ncbi:MAG TPA: bifunctional DNA primase/polymerase [Gemmata sp.]|nr:bifunctional DNA primase/polymerase [Gemmata sp.]
MPLAQPKVLGPIEQSAPVDQDAVIEQATSLSILEQIDLWLRSPPTPNELWQFALEYRRLGWNVFPVRGKKPAVAWKSFQSKWPPLTILRRMIDRPCITGLAVVPGWVSGHKANGVMPATKLSVRDFDTREAFLNWAEQYPHLATILPLVRTKRGFHVYCWSPYEVFERFDDGELRAKSNCFVLLPPSQHPDGPVYRWVIPIPYRPADMPILCPKAAGFYPPTREVPHPSGKDHSLKLERTSSVTQEIYRDIEVSGSEVHGSEGGVGESDEGLSKPEWEALWVNLPDGPGQRHRKLFDLARRLKGLLHLADAPADSLRIVVCAWWRRALPFIRTKDWEETWRDFLRAWELVAFPIGTGPIHEMMRATARESEPLEASGYTRSPVRRLVTVCKALQVAAELRGSDRFYLACRTAAVTCGFDGPNGYHTAARWLKRLVSDGVLELVKAGIGGTNIRLASEYRFLSSQARKTQ